MKIAQEIHWIYVLILKYKHRARKLKKIKHRDKAISIIIHERKQTGFLEIILGGSKNRKNRIKVK